MVLSAWVPVSGQNSGKTANPTTMAVPAAARPAIAAGVPQDPKDLMVLAAKTNGLAGLNDRPWHVKAMYQTFDADGKPGHIGILEEWWAGPNKHKVSYSSPDFQQTIYEDGTARLSKGDGGWPPMQVTMVEKYLLEPPTSAEIIAQSRYEEHDRMLGAVLLKCVQPAGVAEPWQLTLCFNKGSASVRATIVGGGLYALFDNTVQVDGHYVAKKITVLDDNMELVSLNVMTLEYPTSIPEADLTPPATAVTAPLPPVKSSAVTGSRVVGASVPYPAAAMAQHIEGTVMLSVVIDKKGKIADLKVIAGPKALRDAALKDVRARKFKPYLLDGEPEEVETQVNVSFLLIR